MTTTTKPRRWVVSDEREIDGRIYIEDELGVVAIVANVLTGERDAPLIAAAPRLLEALRIALDALDGAKGNINPERGFADEVEAEVSAAIGEASAAIADATRSLS